MLKEKTKKWLTVGAIVLLVFTVSGIISSVISRSVADTETNKRPDVVYVPEFYVPINPGDGKYAFRDETLDFTYEGDYTAAGFDLGFRYDTTYALGGSSEDGHWLRTKYGLNNIYLELGKSATKSKFVHFDRLGDVDFEKNPNSKVVFEMDFKFSKTDANELLESYRYSPWFYRFEFNQGEYSGNVNSAHLSLFLYLDDQGFSVSDNLIDVEDSVRNPDGLSQCVFDNWTNLRVEFYKESGDYRYMVYINDVYLCEGFINVMYTPDYINRVRVPSALTIEPRYYATNAVLGLDNVFFGVDECAELPK